MPVTVIVVALALVAAVTTIVMIVELIRGVLRGRGGGESAGVHFRNDEPVECMGYDVLTTEDGAPAHVKSCQRLLDKAELHTVAQFAEDAEGALSGGNISAEGLDSIDGSGTAVIREFCAQHCPGGCDRGWLVHEAV